MGYERDSNGNIRQSDALAEVVLDPEIKRVGRDPVVEAALRSCRSVQGYNGSERNGNPVNTFFPPYAH
jgi:hypothetical protein